MLDTITRILVLLGYGTAAVLTARTIRRVAPSWYRRWALHAIGIASAAWSVFYGMLAGRDLGLYSLDLAVASDISRVMHMLTLGAFLTLLFVINRAEDMQAEEDERRLEALLSTLLDKETGELD